MMAGFYHYLTRRVPRPNGEGCVVVNSVIGSNARNIDDAANERSKIAANYDSATIVALTTHDRGYGPACLHR